MKRRIITIIVIIAMFLLVATNVSALTLKLEPSKLNLNGEPDTGICTKLTIEYSVPNGLVEGRDLWAEEGIVEKDLSLHTLNAEDLDLVVTYPESINILGSEDVDVCVIAGNEGLYHGALLYRTIQGGGVGIELNVWIIVDTRPPYFEKDEPKEISAESTVLGITTNEDVSGWVRISKYEDSIEKPYGKDILGDLIEINAPEIEDKLESVTIKKYYTIEQLNENSLDEDSLKLYYYNGEDWEQLNSNVNKNAKYVSATLNHFSIFGIFGDILGPPSKPVIVDDGDSTVSITKLHAQWSSTSAGSGISEYMYAIGTSPEATNVVDWTSTTQTSITKTGLSLGIGKTYYFSVKAKNDQGWSEIGVSNGIKVVKGSGSGGSSRDSNRGSSNYYSSSSENSINSEKTGAPITGGAINLGSSNSNEKNSNFLITGVIVLFILIALIVIFSVKKIKKRGLLK